MGVGGGELAGWGVPTPPASHRLSGVVSWKSGEVHAVGPSCESGSLDFGGKGKPRALGGQLPTPSDHRRGSSEERRGASCFIVASPGAPSSRLLLYSKRTLFKEPLLHRCFASLKPLARKSLKV